MKKIIILLALIFSANLAFAADKIKVVATVPDLADLAEKIGGELVEVKSIATGVEDPHSVPMKPSFATLLNRADILIVQGLDLEHAFLPGLLDAARNPKIAKNQPAYIDCSANLLPLEVPTKLDRALGEQHPLGNPHYNLDPLSVRGAAKVIAEGLSDNYPQYRSEFERNLNSYLFKLDSWIERWKKEAEPLRGVKFVSYHPDFIYFANRYGMQEAGTIELRAGVDATPSHIADLKEVMQKERVKLVIRETHYPAELAKTIADSTGATLVELPIMTKGTPEAKDYISFVNYNLEKLLAAVKKES